MVFKLSPPAAAGGMWTEEPVHAFADGGSDGANPLGGLIMDSRGNLYGTTSVGGVSCPGSGCGVVFQLSPPATDEGPWTETVLDFFSGVDGALPATALIMDSNGNLFGTTVEGGGGNSWGVVFEVPVSGGISRLHAFEGAGGGFLPIAGVIMDSNGNLYGTTFLGGGVGCQATLGCGVVFELSPPESTNCKQQAQCRICEQLAQNLSNVIGHNGPLYTVAGWKGLTSQLEQCVRSGFLTQVTVTGLITEYESLLLKTSGGP